MPPLAKHPFSIFDCINGKGYNLKLKCEVQITPLVIYALRGGYTGVA